MFRRGLVKGKLQVGGGDRKTNEPEYEEVGPPIHLRKVPDAAGDGQNCDLCGSAPAAVRCDRCGSQAFCLSCDDMYHRHPRRSTHARKAVDSRPPTGGGIRPPLPPKGESQGGVPPPQPPPRKNKRAGFLSSSAFNKKEQIYARPGTVTSRSTSMTNLQSAANENNNSGGRTIMGSLKRFMGARPLPPTPHQNTSSGKNEPITALPSKSLIRATTSPSLPNLSDHIDEEIRMGLPQSVLDLNTTVNANNNSISTPVTPASAHAQYPPLQPKTPQSSPHTHSLGRKFSLQQLPQSFDDKRTSMVDPTSGGAPCEGETAKLPPRTRSHSVSDDQWAQMLAAETNTTTNTQSMGAPSGPTCPPGHVPADMSAFAGAATRRGYNSMNNSGRSGGGGTLGRGMVSSASVCDLNTLTQQQPPHGFSNAAGSFQQLNMMGYGGGMMWGAPCDLCQAPAMFTGHPSISGMKRTASNLSMNLSSVGSDMSGYPWAPPPHMHHHMPMYPGYYPGYHPHMPPPPMGTPMGLNMSIPDSMHTFGKVPSSPAPSVRSSSHRSHKSAKSRSFSAADASGRRSRNRKAKRSEDSEESRSTSVSEDEDDIDDRESKSGHGGVSSLAWQCDHCTFINSGGARTCGMCSKTVGSSGRSSRRGSERRRSERRRDRRTDQEDNERDVSDYDNDGGVVKSNFSFNIKESKREARNKVSGSSKSKSKKKSRRRDGSESQSESGSEGEEEEQLERHMRDLKVSSSSRRRGSDHDGGNNKDRDRERTSRKKEGSVGRFKNRGKSHSERSRTPGRQTPRRASPADDQASREGSSDRSLPEDAHTARTLSADRNGHPNSQEGTLVDTMVSEATLKSGKNSKSDSSEHKSKSKGSKAASPTGSVADEEPAQEELPQAPVLEGKDNGEKSRSQSPRLGVRKSKSPALSQRTSRGEGDDPSFANTLDDIATMGTNEVADQDLSSHYLEDRPHSTDILVVPHDDVPVVNYIRPVTPEEQEVDEPQTIVIETPPVRKAESHNIEVKVEAVIVVPEDAGHIDNKIPAHEPLYEPSYETVGQPVDIEAPVLAEIKSIINTNDTDKEQDNYHTATTGDTAEMKLEEKQQEKVADEDNLQEVNAKHGSPMDFRGEMARSASSGSSLGLNSLPPDRQYTPLSFSSSDAQFYSPPDSPDISLSEQLQDKPPPGFTQTVVAREEEYLVTALETMQQTIEDLKSSRETIRSSMEQLPYSEEVSVGEEEVGAPGERPTSAGSVTSVTSSIVDSVPPATFGNSTVAPVPAAPSLTDAYESLSFQDALTPSGAADLEHSAHDKAVRVASQQAEDDARAASSLAALLEEVERQRRSLEQQEAQVNEKYLTVEEIITRRRQEAMRKQGLQLVQILRDAEDAGYASEDVSIALTHCGDKNPLEWLRENWRHMVDTVSTLATNYGQERSINNVGAITAGEARVALRLHKGNIWAAVTECVEQRQNKLKEISARGGFKREDVVRALENHDGDADAAFLQLNKTQLQPFMMKIWGALKGETKHIPKTESAALVQKEVQTLPHPPSQQVALPTSSQASVSRPAQDSVSRPAQDSVPRPAQGSVLRPAQASVLRPAQVSVPRPAQVSVPRPAQDSVPRPAQGSVLRPAQASVLRPAQDSVPRPAQGSVLRPAQASVPRPAQASVPRPAQGDALQATTLVDASSDTGYTNQGESQEDREEEEEEEEEEATGNLQETQALQFVRKEEPVAEAAEEPPEPVRVRDPVLLPLDEPGMAQTRTGPVTVQKASVIVGKAIAKAMARETSARESLSRSVTPEVQEAPVATPEASESEEEMTIPGTTTDSDDDDHLRILDTILEEEEISEMTESGRVISRPASKNVVQLSPVTRFLKAVAEPKASTAPSKTSGEKGASEVGLEAGAGGGPGHPASQTSPVPHSYYNTLHTYYNESGASELAEAQTVKITTNDYETMYEMKRQLDNLRDSSDATLEKINLLVVEAPQPDQKDDEEIYYEEVTLKSESESSNAQSSRRRRRRRQRTRGSSSTAGASSRADVSEASIASSSPARVSPVVPSPTAPSPPPPTAPPPTAASPPPTAASPPPTASSPPPTAPSPAVAPSSPAPTPSPVPVHSEAAPLPAPEETEELVPTVTIKRDGKRSRISDNRSYSIIESGTPTQLKEVTTSPQKHEPVENTSNLQRRRNVREDSSSNVSNTPSSSTPTLATTTKDTSPSTSTPAAKGTSLSTSTTATSAASARKTRKASLPESSGDSEDEDGGVKVHRVSVEDLPKIPHLLVQIEGLKARQNKKDPDYQEMRELKEQIQMMRRQLEARMEGEDGRPETPESPKEQQQQPSGADIILQETQEKPVSREYEQLQFDRTVRRLLAEGRAGSYEKAEMAAQLLTFKFGEMDSLQAAEECSSIYTAIQFLQQECELCAEKYPMRKMVSMLQCTHRCCCDCAKTYFTFQIKTKNIREVRCPFCNEPDLDANEEINNEYLNNMDILLKNILDPETHELFQRKLRDWTLMKDPNFRWCNKCSSGFISNPRARKLICPDCADVTCALCRATWEGAHEGISCEAFARWKADNDMEVAVQGVAKHLAECGITCPKCKFTYALAKGGCMHFTCTQCKHEFCSGCSQPFRQGSKCSVGPYCARLGLHAHHPRNCLFYLRDKEPQQLQNLLKDAGVSFDTEPVGEKEQQGGARPLCQVQEQKELADGLKDDICGRVVPTGYAGLCRLHYTEYLVEKINTHKLDPVSIFDEADLRVCLRRNGKTVPIRRWESEKLYRDKLIKLIKEYLPLGNLD